MLTFLSDYKLINNLHSKNVGVKSIKASHWMDNYGLQQHQHLTTHQSKISNDNHTVYGVISMRWADATRQLKVWHRNESNLYARNWKFSEKNFSEMSHKLTVDFLQSHCSWMKDIGHHNFSFLKLNMLYNFVNFTGRHLGLNISGISWDDELGRQRNIVTGDWGEYCPPTLIDWIDSAISTIITAKGLLWPETDQ